MDETSLETCKYEAEGDVYPTPSRWLIDPHLEERLNDIDELIQSTVGFADSSSAGEPPLSESYITELRGFFPTSGELPNELTGNRTG